MLLQYNYNVCVFKFFDLSRILTLGIIQLPHNHPYVFWCRIFMNTDFKSIVSYNCKYSLSICYSDIILFVVLFRCVGILILDNERLNLYIEWNMLLILRIGTPFSYLCDCLLHGNGPSIRSHDLGWYLGATTKPIRNNIHIHCFGRSFLLS